MTQHVLDLRGEVVTQVGKLDVQLAHQLERVPRSVEEIGVAEGDVACPGRDQATDVLQHHAARYREEAAAVDRRDGAMQARVQAATTGLDVSRRDEAVPAREIGRASGRERV